MMKRGSFAIIGIFFLFVLVIGGIFWIFAKIDDKNSQENNDQENNNAENQFLVEITSSGFSPSSLEVTKGSQVTFINKDGASHWPASNMHPTHTEYPGSGINKCSTSQQAETFDACHTLSQGESFSFIFNEIGTWNYHDHLNPDLQGTIVVR